MDKIMEIKHLYTKLLSILLEENNRDLNYIINQIEFSIEIINKHLSNSNSNQPNDFVISELASIYKNIYRPRVGLSDYFIWKDDYEERLQANLDLDKLKTKLFDIFKSDN